MHMTITLGTFTLGIIALVLTIALWHCYKVNKPLREKAREAAEEAAKKKALEEAQGREKNRRENFRIELFSDLEQVISTPDRLIDLRYGVSGRGTSYRWTRLADFILSVKRNEGQEQRIKELEDRLSHNSVITRSNEKLLRDIAKALQLGQPIE